MRSRIRGFWRQLSWLIPLSTFIVIYSTPIWGVKEVCIILLWVLTYIKIILSPKEDIYPSVRGFSMIIELLAWIFMFKSFWDPHSFSPKEYWSPKCWSVRGCILNTGYCKMYFNYKRISNIKYHNIPFIIYWRDITKCILPGNILDWILITFLFWFTNPRIFIPLP